MARIGDVEAAARYDGIPTGPRFYYEFETQAGVPVDGSDAGLRDQSPFTIRLLPPDALLIAGADLAGQDLNNAQAEARAVDLITSAALGNDSSGVRSALARVTAIEAGKAELESFVANGIFSADMANSTYPTIADAVQAADIALQLKYILDAPPLTLLVNPNNMTISYTSIQNYATRTRFGYVFERWGEDQPTISFSGSTGAFIAGVAEAAGTNPFVGQVTGDTPSVSGVQFASKRDSAAWQNLMALYHFYRNNGYIYDIVGQSEAHHFVGAIAIDYDQWTYIGHIESFSYSYEEASPHKINWTIEFKVSRVFDLAQSSYVVMPQTAPTPSPSDPAYSIGRQNNTTTTGDISTWITVGQPDPEADYGTIPFELLG